MWLAVGNLRTAVTRATNDEVAFLNTYLCFEDARAKYRTGKMRGQPLRQFDMFTKSFPTGYLSIVVRAARKAGHTVEIDDRRTVPCTPLDADQVQLIGAELRDYQADAVERAVQRKRGIIHLATGGGKTEIAIMLAQRIPCRWLFIVHRMFLADQSAERFTMRTGEPAGLVGEGKWYSERFTACTFQTLKAALHTQRGKRLLDQAEAIMVDECHVLPAESFWRVAMSTPNAYFRLGLSGTPLARGDKRSSLAVGALGPVIYRMQGGELVGKGVLAAARIRMVPCVQQDNTPVPPTRNMRVLAKKYAAAYDRFIVNSQQRNALLVQLAQRATKPGFLFVKQVEHGQLVTRALIDAGVRAEFVWGTQSLAQRKASIERLVRGDIDIVVCSVVFQEGVDCPDLRSVIVGCAGKSVIAALQRVGRGTRKTDDKHAFEVWDVQDIGQRWLARHADARQRAYQQEGFSVSIDGQR